MKRLFPWLLVSCIGLSVCLARAQAQASAPLMVEAGHTSFIARPGITAAYSLDADTVQAEAVPGGFRLVGKMPGTATIMLVGIAGARPVTVTVTEPPRPRSYTSSGAPVYGQTVEFGEYDVRYNNSPSQFSGLESITQIAGDRRIHVQFMNTDTGPGLGQTPVEFPLVSYEIAHGKNSVTLIDQSVNNSDLTVNGAQLRGVHILKGPWQFHGGITSMTQYQGFLLPSERIEVAGLSRDFQLNERSSLEGNLYYFKGDSSGVTSGPLATALYRYSRGPNLGGWAEIGVGNGFAVAAKLDRDTRAEQLHGYLHYQSPTIAALSINSLHGREAQINWTRKFTSRWVASAGGSDTDINLPGQHELADSMNVAPLFWVNHHVGITGGLTAARFLAIQPSAPGVRSFGYLVGPQFAWRYAGGAFQYQDLRNTGTTPDSRNYSVSAQAGASGLNASVSYDRDTEAPVFAPIQTPGQPDLRQLLFQESQAALTPGQMGSFLRQTAPLASQGFMDPLVISLAALRQQYGVTITSDTPRAGHVTFQGMLNTNSGGNSPSLRLLTAGLTWTRKFGVSNVLNLGFSIDKTETTGTSQLQPILQFGFRHKLNTAPRWLLPGRRGSISGHVFLDNDYAQVYHQGDPPLAGVLIYLDGRRTTHTDSNGYFAFHGVPWGTHSVEAEYHSSRPFFYTSGSPKSVPANGTADFGISFAKGRIFGKFTDDAGNGLQVTLQVQGPGLDRQVTTDGFGSIEIDGLPNGTYTIHPDPSSLPPGYSLAELADQTVTVTADTAGHFHLQVPAQRSLSGRVTLFDPTTGKTTPLSDLTVTLAPGNRSMQTDADGRFLFRHLGAGSWTVSVIRDGKLWTRSATLSAGPDIQTGVDLTVTHASPQQSLPAPILEPPPANQRRRQRPRSRSRSRAEARRRQAAPPASEPSPAPSLRP